MTNKPAEIGLDSEYGLGEINYSIIKKSLSDKHIENIIEFGSGLSTVRLSHDYQNASITSIEQSEKYSEETIILLKNYNIRNAKVNYCPLKLQAIDKLRYYLTYDITNIKKKEYDFVLIDGPVERKTVRGREGVLYMVFPLLRKGCIIVLDDYHRDSSKKAVRNWLNTYQSDLTILEEHDKIIILQKTNSNGMYKLKFSSVIDNWKSFFLMLRRNFKYLLI